MKIIKITVIGLLIGVFGLVHANPNAVINISASYSKNNQFISPDKILLAKAVKSYQDGYNKSALSKFMQAAAFGNSTAQRYIGLMHIKGLGTQRNWAKGYAWIKLAALDQSKKSDDLRKSIFSNLKSDEIEKSAIYYSEILEDYDVSATLKRRSMWVKRQKRNVTGSRVGSQSSNVQTTKSFQKGVVDDNNMIGHLNEMEIFVDDYNFGVITQGEIISKD